MVRENILLIYSWILFAVIAGIGSYSSFDSEKIKNISINFSSSVKAIENVVSLVEAFAERKTDIDEQYVYLAQKEIENDIDQVEKNLSKKEIVFPIVKKQFFTSIVQKKIVEEANPFFINNEEPFALSAFAPVKKQMVSTLAHFEEPALEDETHLTQAGSEKNDDLIFIDRSEQVQEEIKIASETVKTPEVSGAVSSAIERSIKEIQAPIQKKNELTKDEPVLVSLNEVSAPIKAPEKKVDTQKRGIAPSKDAPRKMNLKAVSIQLGTKEISELQNFEFTPSYDDKDILSSENGAVLFEVPSPSKRALVQGQVFERDSIPTRVSLNLSKETDEFSVPLFKREAFEKFLAQYSEKIEGGMLLISLGDEVVETAIDTSFKMSFYLDENFEQTKDKNLAFYHLYVGVPIGNVLVHYKLKDTKQAENIVFVSYETLTFDANSFLPEETKNYTLYEERLFSKSLSDFQISANDFRFFNTDKISTLQGLNLYEIVRPPLPSTLREYFEIGSSQEGVFLGTLDEKALEVPSEDFRLKVKENFSLSATEDSCFLQLNLKKPLKEIIIQGEAQNGPMNFSRLFLDKSGNFSEEYDETTRRLFFTTTEQGAISYRLNYLDETSDVFTSYCSPKVYIIEQL